MDRQPQRYVQCNQKASHAYSVINAMHEANGFTQGQVAWNVMVQYGIDHLMDNIDMPPLISGCINTAPLVMRQQFIAHAVMASIEQGLALGETSVSERFTSLRNSLALGVRAHG